MREQEPVTETMKASEVRQSWAQLLNRVFRGEARVVVERGGIPIAAIISARDLERFRRLEEQRERDLRVLDDSQAAFKGVPPEEIELQVAKAIAEVRADSRAQSPTHRPTSAEQA
jgi:prevent-host-death family protein